MDKRRTEQRGNNECELASALAVSALIDDNHHHHRRRRHHHHRCMCFGDNSYSRRWVSCLYDDSEYSTIAVWRTKIKQAN